MTSAVSGVNSSFVSKPSRQFLLSQTMGVSNTKQTKEVQDVFNTSAQTGNTCTDGADDGLIGIWEGIKSFFTGAIVKPIKSAIKNPIKTALTIAGGAALIAVTGGAATPFLIAGGLLAGGAQLGQGLLGAFSATTDADKKDALENLGSGAVTVAASCVGAKAYAKSVTGTSQGFFKSISKTFKNSGWQGIKDCFANAKTNVQGYWNKSTLAGDFGTIKALKAEGAGSVKGMRLTAVKEAAVRTAKTASSKITGVTQNLATSIKKIPQSEVIQNIKSYADAAKLDGAGKMTVMKASTSEITAAAKACIQNNITPTVQRVIENNPGEVIVAVRALYGEELFGIMV